MNAPLPADALPPAFDTQALKAFIDERWDSAIVPALTDYIAVPAKSPAYDPDWEKNQYIERVVREAAHWVERQPVPGLVLEVTRNEKNELRNLFLRLANTCSTRQMRRDRLFSGTTSLHLALTAYAPALMIIPQTMTKRC